MRSLVLALAILWASPATAQGDQSSTGRCSPNVSQITGDVNIFNDCPYLRATYELSESAARGLAGHYEITIEAVNNFFARLGHENVPPYAAQARFEELVGELIESRAILADLTLQGVAGERLTEARTAVANGEIEAAKAAFDRVIESIGPVQERTLEQIRDIARVHREKGRTEMLLHNYGSAVVAFETAISLLPARFARDIAQLHVDLANAIYLRGGAALDDVISSAAAAVDRTQELADIDPVLRLGALGAKLRGHFLVGDATAALALFEGQIDPLLDRPEVRAHREALLCFACLGGVLIEDGRNEDARRVLERGASFGESLTSPDRLGLASVYGNLSEVLDTLDAKTASLDRAEELMTSAFPGRGHPDFANIDVRRAHLADAAGQSHAALDHVVNAATVRLRYFGGLNFHVLEPLLFSGKGVHVGNNRMYMRGNLRKLALIKGTIARIDSVIAGQFQSGDAAGRMTSLRQEIGGALLQNDYPNLALAMFRDAIKISDENGENRVTGRAHFLVAQIVDVMGMGTPEEAAEHYVKALALYEKYEGFAADLTWDVRRTYAEFLFLTQGPDAAHAFVSQLEDRCPDANRCAAHWQVARLRGMIDG